MSDILTTQEIKEVLHLAQTTYRDALPDRILLGKSDIPLALRSHIARQLSYSTKVRKKYPTFAPLGIFLPEGIAYEQSSSEATAHYKGNRFGSSPFFVDGTGGLGMDFIHLAQTANKAIYLEKIPALVQAASYNIPHLLDYLKGKPKELIIEQKSLLDELERLVLEGMELLYFDPARRSKTGKRTYALADTEPSPLEVCERLRNLNYKGRILIKISPMEDLKETLRILPHIAEIHIIQSDQEVKELLLYITSLSCTIDVEETRIVIVHLAQDGSVLGQMVASFAEEKAQEPRFASQLQRYLLIPSAALLKSGLYHFIASYYGALPLHPNSHLYTSEAIPTHFFGKSYEIIGLHSAQSSTLKQLKKIYPEADFSQRNFPLKPIDFYKKTGIKQGNKHRLIGTTLLSGETVIIEIR